MEASALYFAPVLGCDLPARVRVGMSVLDSKGRKLAEVTAIYGGAFQVSAGSYRLWLGYDSVAQIDATSVTLRVPNAGPRPFLMWDEGSPALWGGYFGEP